jgi:hypothetical protein
MRTAKWPVARAEVLLLAPSIGHPTPEEGGLRSGSPEPSHHPGEIADGHPVSRMHGQAETIPPGDGHPPVATGRRGQFWRPIHANTACLIAPAHPLPSTYFLVFRCSSVPRKITH